MHIPNEQFITLTRAEWYFQSSEGYAAMVTDGTAIFRERRDQIYVHDKAEEWASCIEAEVHQLSSLILSELCKTKALSLLGEGSGLPFLPE